MTGPASPHSAPGPADLLLVDDNEQNLELLEAFLEDLGASVRTASDGLGALAEVKKRLPDLILLDIMMPRMSGFQCCLKLKADPATRAVPVIMVTALNEESDRDRAMECGADAFISKPLNKADLLDLVRKHLPPPKRGPAG